MNMHAKRKRKIWNHNHRNHFNLRISARYAVYFFFHFIFILVIIFDVYRALLRFLLLLLLTIAFVLFVFVSMHNILTTSKTIVFLLVLALFKEVLLQTSSLCKSSEFSSSSTKITANTIVYMCLRAHEQTCSSFQPTIYLIKNGLWNVCCACVLMIMFAHPRFISSFLLSLACSRCQLINVFDAFRNCWACLSVCVCFFRRFVTFVSHKFYWI